MPRPMPAPRFAQAGTCPACGHRFTADDQILLTRSGDIACASHQQMFVPEAIVGIGRYAERQRLQRT